MWKIDTVEERKLYNVSVTPADLDTEKTVLSLGWLLDYPQL